MNKSIVVADLKTSMDLAEKLAKSELVPVAYRGKPHNILVAIQWGMEIGLTPMRSLQALAVINGKPAVYGDELLALVKSHPKFRGLKESVNKDTDNWVATCELKRDVSGEIEITSKTFSIEDSKKARLWGKQGPWSQYPERMLQMRARGFAIRDAFPDALKGIITYEELRDYPQEAQGEDVEKRIKVLPSDAEDLDALANKIEHQEVIDQSPEVLKVELVIPGKESKTFDDELSYCKAYSDILISVNGVEKWSNATKREKVEAFQKANADTIANLQDKELQQEIMDKLKGFYDWLEKAEVHETESLSAMADEMDSRGDDEWKE